MNDFLEQILARNYAPASDIRPRPVARFEAPTDAQPSAVEGAAEPPSAPPNILFREEARPVFALAPERQSFSAPVALHSLHDESSPPAPTPLDVPARERFAQPAEQWLRETPVIQREREVETQRIIEREKNISVPQAGSTKPLPPSPPERESVRPAPVVIQNIIARPREETSAGESFMQAATEPMRPAPGARQTTVRVQIGRIEISAPSPAPAPPVRPPVTDRRQPAALKPAHSLDEYLRRRSGGKS